MYAFRGFTDLAIPVERGADVHAEGLDCVGEGDLCALDNKGREGIDVSFGPRVGGAQNRDRGFLRVEGDAVGRRPAGYGGSVLVN